jgi:inner membrane protease subunit 2
MNYRSPQEYGKLLVKRLIALPGDKVVWPNLTDLSPSNLSIISPALYTHQVKTLPPYPDTEVIIPDGHGWLEGDAPFNSEDSNHFGPVSCPHVVDTFKLWITTCTFHHC